MTQVVPCDWPIDYGLTDCSVFADSGMEEAQEKYEAYAIELLWNWTNRVFGTCPVTVRPCKVPEAGWPSTYEGNGPYRQFRGFGQGPYIGTWQPALIAGEWFNLRCGACGSDQCACEPSALKSIHLPGPVVEVTEVVIEGETLDPAAYRIENNRWLVRIDGETWPMIQNLDAAPGSPNTWTVDYVKGIPVPSGGQLAAGTLACELGKAAARDNTCALPQRLQSITRQGVSMAFADSFDDLKEGGTGIFSIDTWVAAVTKPRPFSAVYSPDTQGTKTWPY